MNYFIKLTMALAMVIAVVACSSSAKTPEKVAEEYYLHYFDGSYPGPNDEYAKMSTNESQQKEFQRILKHSQELNMEKHGAYKGCEILNKKEAPDGNKVTLEIEFKHEKQNKTKEYTLYKTTEGSWVVK